MNVLVIDNYDSFTYNLVQYLGELGADIEVVRNDRASVDELLEREVDRLVVSPGPRTPGQAGITLEAVRRFPEAGISTLGVCLGHQALVQAYGGTVVQGEPVHGKDALIEHDGRTIFEGLPSPLTVGRYHSLIAGAELPDCFELSASYEGIAMAVRHRELPAEGVQFHPESVLTPEGKTLLANFLGVPAPGTSGGFLMPNDVLTRAIDAVAAGEHLTADHASTVLAEIMEGRSSDVQTGAFLIALRAKGETVPELVGLARTMRALAAPVVVGRDDLVDTAGTGGGPSTFNVSTTAALIAAGAGCAVAKHGNRSNTSRSGSADVLEALGVGIDRTPEEVGRSIGEVGFGFMFAPAHHSAMKHVMPTRKELGVRTIFNFLGPLTNPAGAKRQLLGVADRHYQETIAEALAGLGCDHALVVAGEDGLDELTIAGPTRVIEVREGKTSEWFVEPADVDLEPGELIDIAGGDPVDNAVVIRSVLAGDRGPAREISLLNAGAAIFVGGGAHDLPGGVDAARHAIDSGAAARILDSLRSR